MRGRNPRFCNDPLLQCLKITVAETVALGSNPERKLMIFTGLDRRFKDIKVLPSELSLRQGVSDAVSARHMPLPIGFRARRRHGEKIMLAHKRLGSAQQLNAKCFRRRIAMARKTIDMAKFSRKANPVTPPAPSRLRSESTISGAADMAP